MTQHIVRNAFQISIHLIRAAVDELAGLVRSRQLRVATVDFFYEHRRIQLRSNERWARGKSVNNSPKIRIELIVCVSYNVVNTRPDHINDTVMTKRTLLCASDTCPKTLCCCASPRNAKEKKQHIFRHHSYCSNWKIQFQLLKSWWKCYPRDSVRVDLYSQFFGLFRSDRKHNINQFRWHTFLTKRLSMVSIFFDELI